MGRRLLLCVGLVLAGACGGNSTPDADAGLSVPDAGVLPVCGTATSGIYVESVSPANGETRVLRIPTIVVTMSSEAACPTAFPLTLTGASGEILLGAPLYGNDTSCDGATTTLSVQPEEELVYNAAYTLRVQGLADAQGNLAPPCQVTFTVKSQTAAIKTSGQTSLALDEDGALWIWGAPLDPTANGNADVDDIPVKVPLNGKVVAMAVSDSVGLAALADGTVWSWGSNLYGQLGRGTSDDDVTSLGQVALSLPAGVTITDVSVASDHALAARSDGKVMAWGRNDSGELGDGTLGVVDGTPPNVRATPFEVPGLTGVVAVAAASGSTGHGAYDGGFSLALKSDGTVWGWGSNAFGAIDQIIPDSPASDYDPRYPTPVATEVANAKAIAAGLDQSFALLTDGTARGWEWNFDASLGDGTCQDCLDCSATPAYAAPRTVVGASGAPLDQVKAVSAGSDFGLAVRADGSVWGWGENNMGQLGDGTQGQTVDCNDSFPSVDDLQKVPEQLPINGVVGAAAGSDISLVLKSDGSVWGAGYNSNDKIGVGGGAYALTFAKVPGL